MRDSVVKYIEMQSFDVRPVVAFLVRDGYTEAQAIEMVTALRQWLAGHAVREHQTPYVMFHGPVDQAFHAFVLHTQLYADFCEKHVGWFIHHTPLDEEQAVEELVLSGVNYTVNFLEDEFGTSLHPLLKEWGVEARAGRIEVSAVSCVCNGYEVTYDKRMTA